MEQSLLQFARQFILGTRFMGIKGWQKLSAGTGLFLTYHPGLNVIQSARNGSVLTLLGFLLDSQDSNKTDVDILTELHDVILSVPDAQQAMELFIKGTYKSGGRWILIYQDAGQSFILHDAVGMRDVYYAKINQDLWCGSQPHLLAQYLDIPAHSDPAVNEFFQTVNSGKTTIHWSGNIVPFRDVYHLQPNHYLNLISGETVRYGINLPAKTISLQEAVAANALILSNIIKSASNRYKLLIACTAGYDSRVQLAAAKSVKDKAVFYVGRYNKLPLSYFDFAVPRKMFASLKVPFQIIEEMTDFEPEYRKAMHDSVFIRHNTDNPITYMIFKKYNGWLNLSENTLTIFKAYLPRLSNPTGYDIAKVVHQEHYPFIVKCLDNWLAEIKPSLQDKRLNVMDLYLWEYTLGNLLGTGGAQQDIACEELSPSNCRQFMLNFFSVDAKYHTQRYSHIFHRLLIEQLWSELKNFPVNPTFSALAFRFLRRIGIYQQVQQAKNFLTGRR
jgi:hypothetical protein